MLACRCASVPLARTRHVLTGNVCGLSPPSAPATTRRAAMAGSAGATADAPTTAQQQQEEPWVLWYWPGIKGRGEYIRLMFEDAGVAYVDAGVQQGFAAVVDFAFKGGNPGFPVRAPPILQRGGFSLCGTNVIMSYLNDRFGWGPTNPEDRAHVDQILAVVTDAVAEGRLAFHPKDFYKTHKVQVEESVPFVEQYGRERLPKYLQHFEAILARNGGTPEAPGFLVGGSRTAADIAVYHYLAAAQQHFGTFVSALEGEVPLCMAFVRAMAARPRLAAYLQASDRCQPWDADSMM